MKTHPLPICGPLVLIMVVIVACDKNPQKGSDDPTTKSRPAASASTSGTQSSIPSEPTKTLSPLEELIETAKSSRDGEAASAIRKVATHRTDEACALLIKFLREESALIKDKLPSLDEWKRGEAEYERTGKIPVGMEEYASWGAHARRSADAARYLVMLDMPEARQAAYEFRDQLAKKWVGSEVGKIMLDTVDGELRLSEMAVKSGSVPWKTKN